MNSPLKNTTSSTASVCRAFATLCLLVSPCFGEVRDVMTHEQLLKRRSQMTQQDPMKNMEVTASPEDSAKSLPRDIIGQSDILSFGGVSTLVPKQSIILTPNNLAGRLGYVQGNPLVSWIDFYTKNRGWITTVEITFAQAKGTQPLPEAISKQISKSGNLVIATFSGGPISILPQKTQEVSR